MAKSKSSRIRDRITILERRRDYLLALEQRGPGMVNMYDIRERIALDWAVDQLRRKFLNGRKVLAENENSRHNRGSDSPVPTQAH